MKFVLLFSLLAALTIDPLESGKAEARILQASVPIQFVDITAKAGIEWNLKALAQGPKYLIETMGGGGGFIDFNGDGLLDIYLICYS